MHLKNKILLFLIFIFSFTLFSYEEGFAKNDLINIAYRDYGPNEGKPILLVTGLGAQLTLWPKFLIQDLQENNFRPIVFDNRCWIINSFFFSTISNIKLFKIFYVYSNQF
jgi:hypothetical protein